MLPTEHLDIELLESDELPVRTLIAPPLLARELRLVLTGLDLHIHMGSQDAVIISTDLYSAFQEWSGRTELETDEPTGEQPEADWDWN